MPTTPESVRQRFRALHESGTFVMPNPWDRGTARALELMGFPSLATTSAGHAFGLARPDSPMALRREEVLSHVREIVAATDLPVNADFQTGYDGGRGAEGVAESVGLCVETGASGLSIEDATGDADAPLFELSHAIERVAAARRAIDDSGQDVLLTARAECFLVGHPDPLRESIRRLEAYAEAGADVLYAPGPLDAEQIRAIVTAAGPKPVNALVYAKTDMTVAVLADLGVRRISVGSAFARAAWGGFLAAARPLAERGSFEGLGAAESFEPLNEMFRGEG